MVRRLVAAAAAVVALLLVSARPALAHAQLLVSTPAAGAVLAAAPDTITLEFSESVEIGLGGIRLFDGAGAQVKIGTAQHPGGHPDQVVVDLPPLADGTYVVDWQVVSGDSHPVHSAYTFQVGDTATLQSGVLDEIIGRSHGNRSAGVGLALSRGIVALTLSIVLGGLVAIGWGAVEASVRLRRIIVGAAGIGCIAGLLALPLQHAYATGASLGSAFGRQALADVFATAAGRAWVLRALLVLIAGFGLTRALVHRQQRWWRATLAAAVVAVGILAAYGGHGAHGRWPFVGTLTTVTHVAAMAVWLGGLIAVLVDFANVEEDGIGRFSRYALWAVVVLVASGVLQAVRQLGSFGALGNTNYGTVLIWKVVAVVALVAVAAVSRRAVQRAAAGERRLLRRAVLTEAALAALILVATSLLMAANPARGEQSRPFAATLISSNYLASIVIEPGRVGTNALHIYLSSPGSSLDAPDSVEVQISDAARAVAPISIPVNRAGAGHFTTEVAVFPYAAQWTLHIAAVYHTFDKVIWEAAVPIG